MKKEEFPLILSPNLGCPKIIPEKDIKAGIDIIIAEQYGKFVHPTKETFQNCLKLIPSYDSDLSDIPLMVENIKELTDWNQLSSFSCTDNLEETQHLLNSELHYKILGEETKYWLVKAVPITDGEDGAFLRQKKLPTLYDLVLQNETSFEKKNYHAVQFVKTSENRLNFIHLTDLHLSQRNDDILAEVLKTDRNEDKGNWIVRLISRLFSLEKKQDIRSREDIKESYINFNDNFRNFIKKANEIADEGKLDFIVITGDIVDFVNPGWDEDIRLAENSWRIFLDIVTGKGSGISSGLKIAIFTSTGNHDYRLHPGGLVPYMCGMAGECEKFGITEDEAKNYNYRSFDSSEYPDDERKKLSDALKNEALKRLNLSALKDGVGINIAKILGWLRVNLTAASVVLALGGAGSLQALKLGSDFKIIEIADKYFTRTSYLIISVVFLILPVLINRIAESNLKKLTDILVDNPIHAEVKALHYYFTHINPYFDYAFSYGNNHFIIMDTGADVVTIPTKELMDGELKHLKIGSFDDNILGSSPDSMAFDDRQVYYNWSQIVWLDKVLSAASYIKRKKKKGSIFICVHAPPINYDTKFDLSEVSETKTGTYIAEDENAYNSFFDNIKSGYYLLQLYKRIKLFILKVLKKPIPAEENKCNLTYGTINHFLSQFFFLCLGYRENPHRRIDPDAPSNLEKVDMVLSGHAHINVEFKLGLEKISNKSKKENKIRIYHDLYSQIYSQIPMNFQEQKPFIVQTAACGPPTEKPKKETSFWKGVIICIINKILFWRSSDMHDDIKIRETSPYWRMVEVDKDNHVISFKECSYLRKRTL